MAMQTGVAASKVLILVGAGVTGSVILRSGHLSDLISQLQNLIKNLNDAETSPSRYDAALLAAQVRQLAQEIKELSLSNPVTIFNGNSSSTGNFGSYVLPAAALGAVGYWYMWWKGWSFSDIIFVTKHNMANAVATVSKQLEHVSDALASTKKHLTMRLENLDWKVDEQKEISKLISSDVNDVRSNLNQIGYDINMIHEMVSSLEGKINLIESKQDITNTGLWYLCQATGSLQDGQSSKVIQDVGSKLIEHAKVLPDQDKTKGLQFILGTEESKAIHKTASIKEGLDFSNIYSAKEPASKTRAHRSFPVGLSFASDLAS